MISISTGAALFLIVGLVVSIHIYIGVVKWIYKRK